MRRRSSALPTAQRQMINSPTVVPSTDIVGNQLNFAPADSLFSVQVDTTTATVNQTVVLFDASMGYQLNEGVTMDASVVITGTTADYQFMLNDVAHNASFLSATAL